MRRASMGLVAAVLALGSTGARAAVSDQPTDPLGVCISKSIAPEEGDALMQFIFVAMSRHPSLKPYTTISAAQEEDIAARAGAAMTRLLTEACREQTRAALKSGSVQAAFQSAFSPVGVDAMRRMMRDPAVAQTMTTLVRHMDQEQFTKMMLDVPAR